MTAISTARQQTVSDLLRRSARRSPGRLAIVCGDTRWTYAELDAICDRLARALIDSGVAAGDRVAVLARNSHAYAALRFAVARAGAVLVPVNFMLKPPEIAFILRNSQARLLCVDSGLASAAREAAALDTEVKEFVWLPGESASEPAPGMLPLDALLERGAGSSTPFPEVRSDALAQIMYTSGTESLPKGAMLTHDAVLAEYVSCIVDGGFEASDVVLHALPLYHCAQLDVFLGPSIYLGAVNVVTAAPTPDSVLPKIAEHRVTSFFAPPTVWISLLRSPLFDRTDLRSLTKGYYGASIMPVAVLEEIQRRLPGTRLWNFYGQTEIAPLATVLGPADQIRKAGSAGKAVVNVETRVVDEAGQDVPTGQVGEIVHRSPQLMTGYFRDEARTAAAFEGGWFHSGDLGVMDAEGYVTVVDRKKDMIKTGGENVASREVEERIIRLPQVSEVAVVGTKDPVWVEAVTAIVVLKEGATLDEAAVIAHCKASGADFKAPKRVFFARSLPRTPSGKILKRDLRKLLDEGGGPERLG